MLICLRSLVLHRLSQMTLLTVQAHQFLLRLADRPLLLQDTTRRTRLRSLRQILAVSLALVFGATRPKPMSHSFLMLHRAALLLTYTLLSGLSKTLLYCGLRLLHCLCLFFTILTVCISQLLLEQQEHNVCQSTL